MIPLGTIAPDFTLLDVVSQSQMSLTRLRGERATVIMFICNHCPYVQHLGAGIVALSNEYQEMGVAFAGISANDAGAFPADGPDMMQLTAKKHSYNFPYLYDELQEVAKSYGASCTPDLFIFDENLKLAYHGQFDDSRPENDLPVTGASFRHALDHIIAGKEITLPQIPSIGCSIKWTSQI